MVNLVNDAYVKIVDELKVIYAMDVKPRSKRKTTDVEIASDNNYVEIDSGLCRLSAKGMASGSVVTILFRANCLVVNGASSGRKYKAIWLAENTDFWAKPGDTLQVVFNKEADSWLEIGRTAGTVGYVPAGTSLSGIQLKEARAAVRVDKSISKLKVKQKVNLTKVEPLYRRKFNFDE